MIIGTVKVDSSGQTITVAKDPDTGAVNLWWNQEGPVAEMKPSEAKALEYLLHRVNS